MQNNRAPTKFLRRTVQEPKDKNERDFHVKTHDSPLDYVSVISDGRCCAGRLLFLSLHSAPSQLITCTLKKKAIRPAGRSQAPCVNSYPRFLGFA
jgi:hypothetical protein